jgi:hypothetical protein
MESRYSQELIKKTKVTFEPQYGRPLTDTEVEEILDNLSGFANVLIDYYLQEKREGRLNELLSEKEK